MWTRCSLLEMQRLNLELTKQNQNKDQELRRLKQALDEAISSNKLAAAYEKIRSLEERRMDVRYCLSLNIMYFKHLQENLSIETP